MLGGHHSHSDCDYGERAARGNDRKVIADQKIETEAAPERTESTGAV